MLDREKMIRDRSVNKNELDVECAIQSTLVGEYGDINADLEEARDRAKSFLQLTEARLDGEIRAQATVANTKITDTAVKAAIIQHKDYQEANETLMTLQSDLKHLQVMLNSLEHKKSMLGRLVDLHVSGYYSKVYVAPAATAAQEAEDLKEVTNQLAQNARLKKRATTSNV